NRIGVVLNSVISDETSVRYPINMNGFYYPEEDGRLDFRAAFNGFDLKSVAPYLKSFSSRFEGGLHGDIAIGGTLSKPRITGDAIFEDGLIKIDMFNTLYRFSDTVFFEDNKIVIKDFVINDLRDNSAVVNGIVSHNSFKNFAVDLSLVSDNFMVMNTSSRDNDLFYGTVFANVNGTVKGPVNNLVVAANATTNRGSSFAIQLSDKQQISEQNFIRFTQKERTRSTVRRQTQSNMKYKVLVNIDANSNVKFSMPMDFSQLTAFVSATGNGNLQLSIASGSPFSLSGDYIIESGAFKLNLMDLVSRELTLENGSSLRWSGSPTDANIDIKGIYAQRVNLATLYAGSSSMEHTSKTVNVESIIALSGQLMNPTIKFDFRLPNADQSTEEEVFAVIDRSNEREMINQTVSLLAMNSFYSSTSNATDNFNTMSTGLGIVANQVSSVVSSMVEFVDVNINYKSGDALVTNQLDIDISKEWNRFYFETTFGIGGDAKTLNQLDNGSANTIIGDVLLGYKISPNFHLVAFNRSNANDYTKQDMPYTQGVGIKYSKDFDTWKSLFSRKKKAKKTATADKGKKK
ncbi:MAG: translocation/assembly module TamB domain-containing protein, partial [Bacteroidales bacterium]|nr:translocation/assembly module TamB domain-containing protein [Bacteroidales bacterium]